MQGVQVQSLGGELRVHMLPDEAKKKKNDVRNLLTLTTSLDLDSVM